MQMSLYLCTQEGSKRKQDSSSLPVGQIETAVSCQPQQGSLDGKEKETMGQESASKTSPRRGWGQHCHRALEKSRFSQSAAPGLGPSIHCVDCVLGS